MDISTQVAAKAYGSAKPVTAPSAEENLGQAADQFAAILQSGETEALGALNGTGNPHDLVGALVQTELAVQTAVSVRDKVVEAYQEILRMPV